MVIPKHFINIKIDGGPRVGPWDALLVTPSEADENVPSFQLSSISGYD